MINNIGGSEDWLIKKLEASGVTKTQIEAARSQGPEAFKQLLEANGIEAPEKPTGKPPEGGAGQKSDLVAKLKAAGASDEQIQAAFLQGPEAVKKLAEKYGIEPSNEKKANQGHNDKNDAMVQKLQAAGVSKSEFETSMDKGPDALKTLLEKYGITQ